jgi:hypothetical protein
MASPALSLRNELTFGIEFEFLVFTATPSSPAPEPGDNRRIRFGNPAVDKSELQELVLAALKAALENAGIPTLLEADTRYWSLVRDGSLRGNLDPSYAYVGVELISPIFPNSAAAYNEVKTVLKVLNGSFRIGNNASTGTHVHVGRGQGNKFTTDELRNVLALLYTYEPAIAQVHPVWRRDGENQEYAVPLREQLRPRVTDPEYLAFMQALRPPDDDELRRRFVWPHSQILRHALHPDIAAMILDRDRDPKTTEMGGFRFDRYCAYNFHNSLRVGGSGTVEFRQHAGTTDGLEAVSWIRACVALVTFARENTITPAEPYGPFSQMTHGFRQRIQYELAWQDRAENIARGEASIDFPQLLREIGEQDLADYYRDRQPLLERRNAAPYASLDELRRGPRISRC